MIRVQCKESAQFQPIRRYTIHHECRQRRLWSRSTSSISYTLISKGSFRGPDIGGKSTHWPAVPTFFPREEESGRGAGMSRLLWKPAKPCIWSDDMPLSLMESWAEEALPVASLSRIMLSYPLLPPLW
ncbi:hypothetical protein EYF80_005457 [Liparis tanakae]|uniref:Uncharacterized protein n=1 Tax=Liparis tanakae TaxID=230148 RepID=A0A4Z2J1J0_9TELE|nr:hypothetical protein EYF80_005457 [Liparis tanakae]